MGKVYFPDMSIFSFLAYLQLTVTELEHKVRKNKRYKGRNKSSSDLSQVERDNGTFLGKNPKRSTAWVLRET